MYFMDILLNIHDKLVTQRGYEKRLLEQ
jgi:hypothetical protein